MPTTLYSFGEADIEKSMPTHYKEEMRKYFKPYENKQDKEYLGCCDWSLEQKIIDEGERDFLIKIKDQRNKIAHELPYLLLDSGRDIDTSLLAKAKELIRQIDVWWIINVELQTDENYVGVDIGEDQVDSSRGVILDYIFSQFSDLSKKVSKCSDIK